MTSSMYVCLAILRTIQNGRIIRYIKTWNFTMQNDIMHIIMFSSQTPRRSMLQCEDVDKNLYVEILKKHING